MNIWLFCIFVIILSITSPINSKEYANESIFTQDELIWLENHSTINVGIDCCWEPIEFLGEDGKYHGLSVDYLNKIKKMTGIEYNFIFKSWQTLVEMSKNKEIDIFSSVSITPNRQDYLVFTKPYIKITTGIFALNDVSFISNIKHLKDKSIAVVKDYSIHDLMKTYYPEMDLILVYTPEEGINKIINKEVFVYMDNSIVVGNLIKKKGYTNIKLIGEAPFSFAQSIGIRNDWVILRDIIQKSLDMVTIEERNEIYNRWVPLIYEKPWNYKLFRNIIIVILFLLLSFFIWNRKLRYQVNKKIKETTRLAAVVRHSVDSIIITDIYNIILYVNPSFENTIGYYLSEIKYESINILRSDKHDVDFYKQIQNTVNSGKVWSNIINIMCKDKSLITEHVTIFPIFDDHKNIINFAAICRDLTKQIELENKLRQSHKMEAIGTLAGGIAHDFNNILFPISGHAQLILSNDGYDSYSGEKAQKIINSVIRAKNLTRQILTFSRQDNEELSVMELKPIVKEVLELIRATIPTYINLKSSIASNCGSINANPTQMHQVIMNLCTNSYHALMNKETGLIKVTLKKEIITKEDSQYLHLSEGEYNLLIVSDTGEGISKNIIDNVFDPFFTTKSIGTGMGLSIVHGIIQKSKGLVQICSQENKGTDIKIYLPVFDNTDINKHSTQKNLNMQCGTERIMVIDDEICIINVQEHMLNKLGYTVTSFTDSLEALKEFRSHPNEYDLVITDVGMPNLTGEKLSIELLKIRSNIPIILCSGYSPNINQKQLKKLGVCEYLSKPILIEHLSKKIRSLLDNC